MKELYELFLKLIMDSDNPEMFSSICLSRRPQYSVYDDYRLYSKNEEILSTQYSVYDDYRRYSKNEEILSTQYTLTSEVLFKDGSPKLTVSKLRYEVSKKEVKNIVVRNWFSKSVEKVERDIESHPVYNINCGSHSYTTTVEEAIKLHHEVEELFKRGNRKLIEEEKNKILNRLELGLDSIKIK